MIGEHLLSHLLLGSVALAAQVLHLAGDGALLLPEPCHRRQPSLQLLIAQSLLEYSVYPHRIKTVHVQVAVVKIVAAEKKVN